jgi:hypothetical protein
MDNYIPNLTNDQIQMVNGIAEILLGVKDLDNRMELAQSQIRKFKEEGIVFNYAGFLSKAGLDNSEEPIRLDRRKEPNHIINKESTSLVNMMEETMYVKYLKDIIYEVVPKGEFAKYAENPIKNKEHVKDLATDLSNLLKRFYKEHDINILLK